jgi:Beta-galactosidase trimerisation domain
VRFAVVWPRLKKGKPGFCKTILLGAVLLSGGLLVAAEPWWHAYTPGATVGLRAEGIETIQPGAVRGVSTLGWYGFWFLDAQEQYGTINAARDKLRQAGVKRIVYYDLGEVGDYAGFFAADGKMKQTGWSLPWWKGGEPLTARWFGLDAFMRDVPWAPYPTAKAYHLKPFTTPDGKPTGDLYAALTRRGLDGSWKFDYSSNARITDDIADRSGLAAISGKQSDRADMQGKTGWQIVRLVSLDFANPQIQDYVRREIAHIIPKLRPDGIHADNFGDNNLGYASQSAFGLWSQQTFRDYMRRHFTRAELERMGIADIAAFDIAAYIRDKPFESRGLRWHNLNPKWAGDPVWCCYRIHLVEQALAYHRGFFAAAKQSARQEKLDCAVFGNTIPFPLGGALMKGMCDIAHFEWSTVHGWWGMRPMGLPPKGRAGYVTRLGAAISDAPFCWPSLYVSRDQSGAGHENLHKVLAFDCLANRGLLDFGHAYLDGYSPGTPQSAGFVNRFIRAQAPRLSHRRYLADVALVHSAWSEIASMSIVNPVMDLFVDEYCGWCDFLGETHRQWDVLPEQELTAKNLARYPVVVLPSVIVLTDTQLRELRRYLAAGGRVVATGQTGTRFGPEHYLAPRGESFALPGARITADKPGAAYWRKDHNSTAARRMTELLDGPGFRPRLETDAPATVGVNLNLGSDTSGPLLTLDLNNCDLVAETDTLRPAPTITTTLRLPDSWRGHDVQAGYVTPEMSAGATDVPLKDAAAVVDREHGTLTLRTPSFDTCLIVFIRSAR